MIGNLEIYRKMYPENFTEPGFTDVARVLIVILLFFAIYIYVRFVENRLIAFINFELVPFVRYRMRLNRIISFISRILKTEIFAVAKNR